MANHVLHHIFAAVALLFSVHLVYGANTGMSCSVAGLKEDAEKSLMSCMVHDTGLMLEIIENIQHPENLMKLNFICKNEAEVAQLVHCMIGKFSSCLPADFQPILDGVLPSTEHWKEIIQFVCKNKEVFGEQCMTTEATQKFMQCYGEKLQSLARLVQGTESMKNLNPLMCKVIRWDQQCFKLTAGKCSKKFIDLTMQLVKMVFTLPDCPNNLADTKMNSALGSILLHGQPLLFNPTHNAGQTYV